MKKYIILLVVFAGIFSLCTHAQDTTVVAAEAAVAVVEEAVAPAAEVAVVEEAATPLDSGNTAWIIVASILVLMMTIPGLALFYGGLVRSKNILSVLMQCFILVGVVSILWFAFGYSFAFGTQFTNPYSPIGGFDKLFLNGITFDSIGSTGIPDILFALFQCMFAIITPALIIGAFAERVKFSGYLLFISLWVILAYLPMAHWVWGGGFLGAGGFEAIDFAGGTVVHINAGISALVMAILVGKRKGFKATRPVTPHNIPFVFIGASLLWLGWFGFNAGSGLAADGLASRAFLVTHLATATAVVTWVVIDWIRNKRPTTVGACTGAVAGLVAITPAAGTAGIFGAIAIGFAAAFICFFMVAIVKERLGYDDSLDAFGVHGIGGIIGSILTGVFIAGEANLTDGFGGWSQVGVQLIVTLFTIAFSAAVTFILFQIVDKTVGIRAAANVEEEGLDIYEHGEIAYS